MNNKIQEQINILIFRSIFTKNKRALGHVEMIISFVFFVGFLLFVFYMLNPIFLTKETSSNNADVKTFIANTSASIGKIAVIVNSSGDCFDTNLITPYYGALFVSVQKTFAAPFQFTLYFGDFFNESIVGAIPCASSPARNFTFGSFNEESFFIEKRIFNLKQRYETDYVQLTRELGMNNFAFAFFYLNKTKENVYSVNKTIRDDAAVYSAEFPVRIIDSNAFIKEMILQLKTWQ